MASRNDSVMVILLMQFFIRRNDVIFYFPPCPIESCGSPASIAKISGDQWNCEIRYEVSDGFGTTERNDDILIRMIESHEARGIC